MSAAPGARKGCPAVFRAALVQTFALARPLLRSGWEIPLPLHLPPSLAWARAKACL
jgi:hypothetical protein